MSAALGSLGSDTPGEYARGVGLVLVAGCLWSTSGLAVRLMAEAGPWQILLYRSVFLFPVVLLLLRVTGDAPLRRVFREIGWPGLAGSLCLAASSVSYILALTWTSVANTAFLISTSPFMTALLAWMLLGERVHRVTWLTMLGASAGIALMVGGGLASGTLAGNVAALCSALGFAGLSVALRAGRSVNMFPTLCLGAVWTGLGAAAVILFLGLPARVPVLDLSLCLNMALVPMAFGGLCYTLGSRFVPAAELTLLSFVEVLLSPLWVWLVVAETPDGATLYGGAIVLIALAARALLGVRRRPPMRTV